MKTLPLILILLLFVIVFSCGCTQMISDNKTEPATSTQSTSMTTATTATLLPTTISVPPEDPIIGSWFCYNYLPTGKIEKIWTFMENNTWTMTNTNIKSQVKKFVYGVWRKESTTIYQVTPSSGAIDTFEYDVTKDEFSDTYFRDTYTRIPSANNSNY